MTPDPVRRRRIRLVLLPLLVVALAVNAATAAIDWWVTRRGHSKRLWPRNPGERP